MHMWTYVHVDLGTIQVTLPIVPRFLQETVQKAVSTKENETTFCDQTGPIKRNRSYHFLLLFRILYTSEEKQGNGQVCEKWNGEFRLADRNSGPPSEVIPNIPVGT